MTPTFTITVTREQREYLRDLLRGADDQIHDDLHAEPVEASVVELERQQALCHALLEATYAEGDECPECARSYGPHYRGPCDH